MREEKGKKKNELEGPERGSNSQPCSHLYKSHTLY